MTVEKATFAGGCFWCMVEPFDEQPGIQSITSGYTGGHVENPTYEEVCQDTTGHLEAVQITFDTDVFPYQKLLDLYWQQIDPTDAGGQFNDRGESYTTAIFYHNEKQKELALHSKEQLAESGKFKDPIVTTIRPAETFYEAEEKHQGYYKKNSFHYRLYKKGSGREAFIKNTWQTQPSKTDLKATLTPIQYHVTQENGTEPPFQNPYYANQEDGIYVNIVTGEPLFASIDQYDAGCGWPSFTQPISQHGIEENMDTSHGMRRIEVRAKQSDSHLGHVFDDGPKEKGGMRYCINSAALRFIKKEDLEKEGLEQYLALFNAR